ncbi:MAG: protein kinase, partial [Myxococcota bacterium]
MRSQIGRYQLQSLLGSGAMGAVYLARDPDVGRLVAIKTLSSTLEPERRERFLREAQALASLKHPN